MDEQLIGVLRRPTGLAAMVSRRQQEFVRPRPVLEGETESLAAIDPYLEEVRPLEGVRAGGAHTNRRGVLADVRASWESLARVSTLDAQTLFHVLHVLVHTLPEGEAVDIPPLKIEPPPPTFQHTAAHPRAYRGTKVKPPKIRRMAPLDLRPHLCVVSDVNRLLVYLAPFLPEARPFLERADLSPEKFSHLVDANGKAIDPYLQYCHSAGERSVHDLPATFRTHLLFWLRGRPWSAVAEALSLYWGLGLATDASLLRCFARFLAQLPLLSALEWGRILLQQPVPRRVAFAELLVEAGMQSTAPTASLGDMIGEVDRLSPDQVYRHRMYTFLVSSRWNKNLDYLLDGFRLCQRYKAEHEFEEVGRCDDFSIGAVEEFIEHVTRPPATGVGWRPRCALTLWEACAELDGFATFLEGRPWQGLEPDVAYEAIEMFREVVYHDLDEERQQAKWRILRTFAPRIFELLHNLEPCYRGKAVGYLRDLVWFWDEPPLLAEKLGRYLSLLPRLCRPPFARTTVPDALTSLTVLRSPEWAELANTDERCFLKLERESRRKNEARLIAGGLEMLAEAVGAWVIQAFRQCPSNLFRAAQVLGCMGATARQEVVQSWREHPLLTLDAEDMTAAQLVQEIERHRPASVHNPTPRKLREAALGKWVLRPGQVQRALRTLLADLIVTRIDLLHRLALDRLAQTVGPAPDTAEARHALCLQGFIRDNRRALRRFLRAYFGGQHCYLIDHPVNRAWLERHPRVADAWLRGVQRCFTLPDSSKAYLSVEQNPLEVLRLGTYVGSCLGLGGIMADSAAAVVLDINKCVIYARDASGTVLGRQLLALAEDERLVCFSVYPLEAAPPIKRAFLDYDRALAEVLKVEIHGDKPQDDGYEVVRLLSSYWWDDDPWDGQKK
jgi:hypothetical protein